MMKKILIINGHPDKESLCFALAERYKKGADSAGVDCKLVNLIDLDFNPILTFGYRKISELEPDLLKMQQEILAAVQELSPAYRAVFNLYVVEGYSHKEIGDALQITESTSRSNLVKARLKLQDYFAARRMEFGLGANTEEQWGEK